ncbi:MAG TPA: hypothetical protein PLJ35_16460 [Anaerolineae bacterium]|nr:hypothetical protein [Anaerolineae bacterium]HOR00406.1 hypothetical protein [Anaerolineae bacterium]HPL28476.1 hypothetical protein [Anaerolineae bacterium]
MPVSVISPQDRGHPAVAGPLSETIIPELGISPAELERRARANTYEWLPRQFDEETGAFYGYYSASERRFDEPQTANLIAPWQLLAAYDRYRDQALLTMARRAAEWFHSHFVVTHPMETVAGGVCDTKHREELWVKYTAESVILNVGLYRRTGEPEYLRRALQSAGFLVQSSRHGFAARYDVQARAWEQGGWRSFGRAIEALLELHATTEDDGWRDHALRWGEFALSLQTADGCFYLIDDDYFNSDLAADELRALLFLGEETKHNDLTHAARRFADWLLFWQRDDGAWPLTVDRDGDIVVDIVGPGDVPNIAVALLHLYELSGEERYRQAALRAFRYALGIQVLPGNDQPYEDDPRVRWGFWSWDPRYDHTLSADQSTHHVRGMFFLIDVELDPRGHQPSVMDV